MIGLEVPPFIFEVKTAINDHNLVIQVSEAACHELPHSLGADAVQDALVLESRQLLCRLHKLHIIFP